MSYLSINSQSTGTEDNLLVLMQWIAIKQENKNNFKQLNLTQWNNNNDGEQTQSE